MLLFLRILSIVYILAVNAYGYILVYLKREENADGGCKPLYGKFLITGVLGGALGLYVAMFVYKFRLDSLVLMIFIPVLIVVNAFVVWQLFSNNFWFYTERYTVFGDFFTKSRYLPK